VSNVSAYVTRFQEYYYWRANHLRSSICSDVATTPFVRNVPQTFHAHTLSQVGLYIFISSFYLGYLHTYYPFYIKRMPRASPSLLLIVPVHWGIYLLHEKKQGPGYKCPSYVCSVAAVETSGISIVCRTMWSVANFGLHHTHSLI
jgi:hypothetical protein